MSVAALEKFNKQFGEGTRKVSEILHLAEKGEFSFYIPAAEGLDVGALTDRAEKCLPRLREIVTSPYVVLKSEYRQTRTELAAGLTPQGILSTVKDPRLWKMKDGRPVPNTCMQRPTRTNTIFTKTGR